MSDCPNCGGERTQLFRKSGWSGGKRKEASPGRPWSAGWHCKPCNLARNRERRALPGAYQRELARKREIYSLHTKPPEPECAPAAEAPAELVRVWNVTESPGNFCGGVPMAGDLDCWGDWGLETTEIRCP